MSKQLLQKLSSVSVPAKVTAEELKIASNKFEKEICKAPTSQNWIWNKAFDQHCDHANQSYPVIHEKVLKLCERFLDFKKEFGSNREKTYYQDITTLDLVEKIISKVRTKTQLGI